MDFLVKYFLLSGAVAVLLLSGSGQALLAQDDGLAQKRILTIFVFRQGLPWAYRIEESMRQALRADTDGQIELDVEHADQTRFYRKEYISRLLDLYRFKYSRRKVDVVIAVGNGASDLLLNNGRTLFGDVPMILVASEEQHPGQVPYRPNMVHLGCGFNFAAAGRIISRLLPKTRHVFVISGCATTDCKLSEKAAREISAAVKHAAIHQLSCLSEQELMATVERLPRNSVILYLTMFRDKNGKVFIPRELMSKISRRANAPTFGIVDTYLGHGIVGGLLLSAETQGKRFVDAALQILKGQDLSRLHVRKNDSPPMFDWRQLKRWSIDPERLPPGSVVRYREPSIWADHKWEIMGVTAVLVMQAIAIAFMIIQRVKRSRAEKESQRLRDEFAHVSRVQVMGELAASLSHEINQPLSAVRSYAQAAKRFLEKDPPELNDVNRSLRGIVTANRRIEEVITRIRKALKKEPSRKTRVQVRDMFADVMVLAGPKADELHISIKYEQDDDLPTVFGDRVQLQQVILNLVMNSMDSISRREGRGGHILVRAVLQSWDSLAVSVHDSGVGINEPDMDRLFDAFYTTKSSGMGIGLSICRTIIEEHGGQLWYFSDPDRGTTFSFALPTCGDGIK